MISAQKAKALVESREYLTVLSSFPVMFLYVSIIGKIMPLTAS